jgi:hypothetical protein
VQNQQTAAVQAGGKEAPKVNIVSFTVKAAYTPSKASSVNQAVPTNASAPAQGQSPAQPAKN